MRATRLLALLPLILAACAGRSFEIGPSPRGAASVATVSTAGAPSGTPGSPLPAPVSPDGSTAIPLEADVGPDGLASTGAFDEGPREEPILSLE